MDQTDITRPPNYPPPQPPGRSQPPNYPPPPPPQTPSPGISSSPPNYPPPQPPQTPQTPSATVRSSPPNYPPPPPPSLMSRAGSPIQPQPGWTLEQSKVFQDLTDRMGSVGKAYGNTIDIKNANEQQVKEAGRFTQGNPALLGVPDELKRIQASTTLSPQQKDEFSKKAFEGVAQLDTFVTGIQTRDYISDKGERKLPLLSVEETKSFDERKQRLDRVLRDVDERMGMKPPLTLDPNQSVSVQKLANGKPFLAELPKTLKGFADSPNLDDNKRSQNVGSLKETMTEMDRRLGSMEELTAQHELSVQKAAQPGFFRRALTSVQVIGTRVAAAFTPKTPEVPAKPIQQDVEITRKPPTPKQETKPLTPSLAQAINVPAHNAPPPFEVRIGDGPLAKPMNVDQAVNGKVESVERANGSTRLAYEFRGHMSSLTVSDLDKTGKPNPLSEGINNLKPGNSFQLAISRDESGVTAKLKNHETGIDTSVRDTSVEQRKVPVRGLEKGLGR